jgi:uncharacterized membrane protein YphA (DoxX/SURF4 family)
MTDAVSCPACKVDLPQGSRFCPQCGVAVAESGTAEMFTRRPSSDTRELLESELAQPRRSIHEAYRRPLGAQPPAFLGALSVVALILGVILLITGPWISAVIALVVFVGLITVFTAAVRHDPHSQAAQMARRSVNNLRSMARFGAVAVRTWARAAVSLLHIKQRRLRIKRELHSQLTPLGEAVHRGDQERAQQLKAQAERLERQLNEIDSKASAILEDARETVEREKSGSQSTQALPVIRTETDIGEGEHQPPARSEDRPARRRRRPGARSAAGS